MEQKEKDMLDLLRLQQDILENGPITKEKENQPFESKADKERLFKFNFFDIQDRYRYGWYIAEESKAQQLASINKAITHIISLM